VGEFDDLRQHAHIALARKGGGDAPVLGVSALRLTALLDAHDRLLRERDG
jgi:hypothetical protein